MANEAEVGRDFEQVRSSIRWLARAADGATHGEDRKAEEALVHLEASFARRGVELHDLRDENERLRARITMREIPRG